MKGEDIEARVESSKVGGEMISGRSTGIRGLLVPIAHLAPVGATSR